MPAAILVVTGASGSGKSAATQALRQLAGDLVQVHEFDSVGVPSAEEMTARWGSPEAWQRAMTSEWVARLAASDGERGQVLDAQVRPSFVLEAFRDCGVVRGLIVLLDCAPEIRRARVIHGRGQPELATARMDTWAAYLRGQADALGLPVIDTSDIAPETAADRLMALLSGLR